MRAAAEFYRKISDPNHTDPVTVLVAEEGERPFANCLIVI